VVSPKQGPITSDLSVKYTELLRAESIETATQEAPGLPPLSPPAPAVREGPPQPRNSIKAKGPTTTLQTRCSCFKLHTEKDTATSKRNGIYPRKPTGFLCLLGDSCNCRAAAWVTTATFSAPSLSRTSWQFKYTRNRDETRANEQGTEAGVVGWERTSVLVHTPTGCSCATLSSDQGLKPKFLLKRKTPRIS